VAVPGRRGKELSSREWEVLDLLREGRTTADIARRLFVSPVTVRRHVSAILRKLDVPDRQAAIDLVDT
jgi:DNA-binding NarL/FixJ family response regulator